MKIKILLTTLGFAICGIAFWCGYERGYGKGYRDYVIYREATFVIDLSVLEHLRSGDITNAITKLEKACYSSANVAIVNHPADQAAAIKSFANELADYRKKYAGPPSTWSPMEQKLEKLLAGEITNKVDSAPTGQP